MPLTFIDLFSIPGLYREMAQYLRLPDMARLTATCKMLHQDGEPMMWLLDREMLLQLKCPPELRRALLDRTLPTTFSASSRFVSSTIKGEKSTSNNHSIWAVMKPIFVDTPLKYVYEFQLSTQHPSSTCQLKFPNSVLVNGDFDVTLFPERFHSSTNFLQKPPTLKCLSKSCYDEDAKRFYHVRGKMVEGEYYCEACLRKNVLIKLQKIRQHPCSYVVWNEERFKL